MTLHPARTDVEPVSAAPDRSPRNGGLLTARDVAELLGVPVSWVYERSRSGRIPTVTLGRYRRYRREAIEAWVRELEENRAA
jgi:excisionase family DNA binding protein